MPVQRRFDAILFDLGNTLIYFDGKIPDIYDQADAALVKKLGASGLVLDNQRLLREFRQRMESYYTQRDTEFIEYTVAYVLRSLLAEHGYPNLEEHALRPALEAMYAVTRQAWHPEVDSLPTLQILRERRYQMGLISNAADDMDVQALVDKAQLRPFFEIIVTSAAMGIRKPNPRIFQHALDNMNVPATRTVMVGDMLGADILGAYNAGLASIWITRRADKTANRDHLDTIQPQAEIATLSELPSLLECWPASSSSQA